VIAVTSWSIPLRADDHEAIEPIAVQNSTMSKDGLDCLA
jgi:hypothetical protein